MVSMKVDEKVEMMVVNLADLLAVSKVLKSVDLWADKLDGR
jgi:hypothetical protein